MVEYILESASRSRDGHVHVGGVRLLHLGNDAAGGRIDGGELFAGFALVPLVVNEQLRGFRKKKTNCRYALL